MAIVADAARNGLPVTPAGRYITFEPATPETHINFAYEAPTNNRTDAWVPHVTRVWQTV